MDSVLLEKLLDQGGLFAIFVLALVFTYRFGLVVFRRLFDSPDGLVTEWFMAQREFMDGLSKREELQTKLCESHISTLGAIDQKVDMVIDGNGRFDHSIVDGARARLLELSVNGSASPEKRQAIEQQIEKLMKAVEERHAML